ncbi:MAG: YfhO family protein [bacterium]|nr:YfhO family protein [bacterium]
MPLKFYLRELGVILLFIVAVCFFFPQLILLHQIPNCGDVNLQFYPQFNFLSYWLKQGIFPLWNPYSFSGTPIFADPQSGFCYPIHIILFGLFNPGVAFGLDLAFHFLLAGWFTYLYLRQLGLLRSAAILGGCCFMFSGFLVPKILIPALVFSAVYLPLLLFAIERLLYNLSYANISLTIISISLLLLSGYPQYIAIILTFAALYIACRCIQLSCKIEKRIDSTLFVRTIAVILLIFFVIISMSLIILIAIAQIEHLSQLTNIIVIGIFLLIASSMLIWILSLSKFQLDKKLIISRVGGLCLALVIATLLCALYLLPAYEFYQHSTRAGMPLSNQVRGIFFWQNLPIIVRDLFAGGGINDFEISGFIGSTAVLLILFSLGFNIIHQQYKKYTLIFWLFILLSGAIVFLEPHMVTLMMRVPALNHFFVFHRYLLIFVFALSALAGLALHNITEYFERQTPAQIARINYSFFIPLVSIVVILGLLFGLLNQLPLLIRLLPGFGILCIYWIMNGFGIFRQLFPILAIVVTLIELHPQIVQYPLEYIYPNQLYPEKTIYTTLHQKDPGFYRILTIEDEQNPVQPSTPAISYYLIPNVSMVYHAFDVQGYNPIMLRSYRDYIDYVNGGNPQRKPYEDTTHFAVVNTGESKLLNGLRVKYLFSPLLLQSEKWLLSFQVNLNINHRLSVLNIYQNTEYFPQPYIVHRARVCKNLRTTLRYLSDATVDPRTTIILNESFGTMVEKQENLIGQTNLRAPRPFMVISSPEKASIQIDNQEINDNLPGYNVVVFNPDTRELDDVSTFGIEACIDTTTTCRFVQYLTTIPDNRIVLIAWKGNETPYLTSDISSSLRLLGGKPEDITGNTFALIGVKGSKPGTAMQNTNVPIAELTIPYPLDILYRYDEEKPVLPEPETADDTTQPNPTTSPEIQIIKSHVNVSSYTPNKIVYQAVLFRPGFLVTGELYYPGWRAYVDGKPTRILKANGIFRTVFLPPGNYQVEFRYFPMSLFYGIIISSLTAVGLVIFAGVSFKRKKFKQ